MMHPNEIAHLAGRIRNLQRALYLFPRYGELNELLEVIYHPGWTDPVEYVLVSELVDSLYAHVRAVTSLQKALSSSAKGIAVGELS